MSRTLLTTLMLLGLVGWLIARPPVDASGAEECLGCRRLRGVEIRFGFRTEELELPGSTARWVGKYVPEHEHHFVRTGDGQRGGALAMQAKPAQLRVPADQWLEYLKRLPLDEAREAVAAFNGDRDAAALEAALAAYEHWLPTRGDGWGTETCAGCRRVRSVSVQRGVRSAELQPSEELDAWVLERVPDHEHSFTLSGCWNDGRTLGLLAQPLQLHVRQDDWFGFLQSLPAESVPEAVEAFTHSTPDFETWHDELQAWREERRRR